jgi:hypothetical protein
MNKGNVLGRMLDHEEAIISHLSLVSLSLGFHTLGLHVRKVFRNRKTATRSHSHSPHIVFCTKLKELHFIRAQENCDLHFILLSLVINERFKRNVPSFMVDINSNYNIVHYVF